MQCSPDTCMCKYLPHFPVESNFLVPRACSFSEPWWLRNDRKETVSKLEMACVLTLFGIKGQRCWIWSKKTHEQHGKTITLPLLCGKMGIADWNCLSGLSYTQKITGFLPPIKWIKKCKGANCSLKSFLIDVLSWSKRRFTEVIR